MLLPLAAVARELANDQFWLNERLLAFDKGHIRRTTNERLE